MQAADVMRVLSPAPPSGRRRLPTKPSPSASGGRSRGAPSGSRSACAERQCNVAVRNKHAAGSQRAIPPVRHAALRAAEQQQGPCMSTVQAEGRKSCLHICTFHTPNTCRWLLRMCMLTRSGCRQTAWRTLSMCPAACSRRHSVGPTALPPLPATCCSPPPPLCPVDEG
jgi:hypothetical protein